MPKVNEIVAYFESLIPPEMKMDFDNVGLLVGSLETEVDTAVVALDITEEVIEEAVHNGAQIILSHHPLFFELKQINDSSPTGKKILKLLHNNISVFCQHTNLDRVYQGVNDALASKLSVSVEGCLESFRTTDGTEYGMGRYGSLESPLSLPSFLKFVESSLNTTGIRYYDAGKQVEKLALCGGSGGEFVNRAYELACDTLVTADVKYHQFLEAKELGVNILDAGHFCTENVVVPVLADTLKKKFPAINVLISKALQQPVKFYKGKCGNK